MNEETNKKISNFLDVRNLQLRETLKNEPITETKENCASQDKGSSGFQEQVTLWQKYFTELLDEEGSISFVVTNLNIKKELPIYCLRISRKEARYVEKREGGRVTVILDFEKKELYLNNRPQPSGFLERFQAKLKKVYFDVNKKQAQVYLENKNG